MHFAAFWTKTFPGYQANDTRTHWWNLFDELFDRMTFAHRTAALRATVQWLLNLLIDALGHWAVGARMTGFSTRSFLLVFGNLLTVASSKGCGLSGTGAPLLFELCSQ